MERGSKLIDWCPGSLFRLKSSCRNWQNFKGKLPFKNLDRNQPATPVSSLKRLHITWVFLNLHKRSQEEICLAEHSRIDFLLFYFQDTALGISFGLQNEKWLLSFELILIIFDKYISWKCLFCFDFDSIPCHNDFADFW